MPTLTRKPEPLYSYESESAYYDARGDRFGWHEVDYGCYWHWGSMRLPQYRVTYVRGSGEIYVMQFGGKSSGRVEVFGYCPDFELLERVLTGWAQQCSRPRSLLWLVSRLKEHGLDRPRTTRISSLAA